MSGKQFHNYIIDLRYYIALSKLFSNFVKLGTCPRRSQPRNGAYFGRYKTIWIVGDVARFSCRNGYIMSGARHSVCQSNGAWSSPQPKCRRKILFI